MRSNICISTAWTWIFIGILNILQSALSGKIMLSYFYVNFIMAVFGGAASFVIIDEQRLEYPSSRLVKKVIEMKSKKYVPSVLQDLYLRTLTETCADDIIHTILAKGETFLNVIRLGFKAP